MSGLQPGALWEGTFALRNTETRAAENVPGSSRDPARIPGGWGV